MLDLWHYILTRMLTWKMAALFLFLFVLLCSMASTGIVGLLVVPVLIFQFRLWDDLVDIDIDRIDDPSRVLCQTKTLFSFKICLLLSSVIAGVSSSSVSMNSFAIWLATCVLLGMWYTLRGELRGRANYRIVLLKYPLILMIALGDQMALANQWITLLVSYAVLCVIEAIDEGLKEAKTRERSSGVSIDPSYVATPISLARSEVRNGISK